MPPAAAHAVEIACAVARLFALKLAFVFVSAGSIFSGLSLGCAFCVAALWIARARRGRGRAVRWRTILRALFPRRLFRHPSVRADVGFFLFNVLLAGGLTGAAILSTHTVEGAVAGALSGRFPPPLAGAPAWLGAGVTTLLVFVAFEFGYYVDHWLSHKVPALWEIHKAHHTAEVLTPLTTFRVHPLESLKFLNILAVCTGSVGGLCAWAFGAQGQEAALAGRNLIFLGLWLAFGHLQHSHLWIAFPGRLGRLFISPAHHQLHHSDDPAHFGRNFGSFLSLFDALFGTLLEPSARRERLRFGVEGDRARQHGVSGGLIDPVTGALAALLPRPAPATGDQPLTSA
jgi:sterol desaturase/sphingolipid hydroxylase (fatty acid hydroxylase superfamily)